MAEEGLPGSIEVGEPKSSSEAPKRFAPREKKKRRFLMEVGEGDIKPCGNGGSRQNKGFLDVSGGF